VIARHPCSYRAGILTGALRRMTAGGPRKRPTALHDRRSSTTRVCCRLICVHTARGQLRCSMAKVVQVGQLSCSQPHVARLREEMYPRFLRHDTTSGRREHGGLKAAQIETTGAIFPRSGWFSSHNMKQRIDPPQSRPVLMFTRHAL
jgi:hypothetical protein